MGVLLVICCGGNTIPAPGSFLPVSWQGSGAARSFDPQQLTTNHAVTQLFVFLVRLIKQFSCVISCVILKTKLTA